MHPSRQISPADFETLRPRLSGRLAEATIDIARAVLVDGHSQSSVAVARGLTRQRVSTMVKQVWAIADEIPKGWERVDVWLPPKLAARVRQMAEDARTKVSAS
jgi:hypothetical protein